MIRCAIGMVVLALTGWPVVGSAAPAPDALPTVSRAEYDTWRAEVSNWGRWGRDDELGTLNFITPGKKVAAADLVKEGACRTSSTRGRCTTASARTA